jgi:hypothetical protein
MINEVLLDFAPPRIIIANHLDPQSVSCRIF